MSVAFFDLPVEQAEKTALTVASVVYDFVDGNICTRIAMIGSTSTNEQYLVRPRFSAIRSDSGRE